MADRSPREVVEAFVVAINKADWHAMRALMSPDYIEDYPQSGERVRGPDNAIAIRQNYPSLEMQPLPANAESMVGGEDRWALAPNFTAIKLTGEGDTITAVIRARYPDGEWLIVIIARVEQGLVKHATAYFGQPFPAPEWRAKWVERLPERDR